MPPRSSIYVVNKIISPVHNRPQRSCEGYVFTRVCHSVVTEGGCYPSMHCRWYPSMPCSRRGACSCSGGAPAPGGVETPPPPKADGYCCGRYASYWNAFLFNNLNKCNVVSGGTLTLPPKQEDQHVIIKINNSTCIFHVNVVKNLVLALQNFIVELF